MTKKKNKSTVDEFFVVGLVAPYEWDWKEFGRWLKNQIQTEHNLYIAMDVYKVLGLIRELDTREKSK